MRFIFCFLLIFAIADNVFASPIPGDYGTLLIAVNKEKTTFSGYYENYTGWDESVGAPRFSCIFYLKGKLNSGNRFRIKTWFPADHDPEYTIAGVLKLSKDKKTLSIKLKQEHGGCWNVETFAGEEAPQFKLVKQANWIDIRVVSSKKAFLYAKPGKKYKRKAYVVKGDALKIHNTEPGWLHVEYSNKAGKITRGWLKESDVFSNVPPT